jgi:hypothetical protein
VVLIVLAWHGPCGRRAVSAVALSVPWVDPTGLYVGVSSRYG